MSFRDYDHERLGPLLGISDDGTAARAIANAAWNSPKREALKLDNPLSIGIGHDAERLNSTGESPVGPPEWEAIAAGTASAALLSTNVGSHVNTWLHRPPPTIEVGAIKEEQEVLGELQAVRSQAGRSRPVWFANVQPGTLTSLWRQARDLGFDAHDLGLLAGGAGGVTAADVEPAIDAVRSVGFGKVVVGAPLRTSGAHALPPPGLLACMDQQELVALQRAAGGVIVEAWHAIDVDAVARQICAGLQSAFARGCALGKYGLVPLTLGQAAKVISAIEAWAEPAWTPAPALYLDVPVVDGLDLLEPAEAARRWLAMLSDTGVELTLIDTVEKYHAAKLMGHEGILTWAEVAELEALARQLGVRVLWAGGLTREAAYRLAGFGVFGMYVTSATADPSLVSDGYAADPGLRQERHPTEGGVEAVSLLVQAGFLARDESPVGDAARASLRAQAEALLRAEPDARDGLRGALHAAWLAAGVA